MRVRHRDRGRLFLPAVASVGGGILSYIRAAREEFLQTVYALRSALAGLRAQRDVRPRLTGKREASPPWSERGFRELGETMDDGLLAADADDRIVYANDRCAELLGYPAREIVGRSIRELVDPAARSLYRAQGALRHRGRTDRFELTFRRADGRPLFASVSVRPAFDARGRFEGSVAALTDRAEQSTAEETNVERDVRLRGIVEHSTNVLYTRTPDHVLTYVSPQARSFFGCEPEEALTSWSEFLTDHPVNRAALEAARKAGDTGQRQPPYDLELRRRDGKTLWVEANEAPVVEDGRTVEFVGTLTDITQRLQRERLLRSEVDLGLALGSVRTPSEAFRHTLEAALRADEVDAGWLHLLDSESDDLVLVRHRGLSEAFTTAVARIPVTGPRGTLVRRSSGRGLEAVDPDALREGLRTTTVLPIRHDGRLLACLSLASRQVDAFPPAVLGALETIASLLGPVIARFETLTSLEKSETTLQSLVRSAPAGIGLLQDRVFQQVNDHMIHLAGYPRRELLNRSARLLYTDDAEFERVGREVHDQIERSGIGSLETQWKRRDGALIDVLLSVAALDRTDILSGIVYTAWDLTARNCAEQERLRLEKQVQQAQKLESLGLLAGGIAHDFNNLLHAIMGHAGMAGSCAGNAGQTETHLDAIERTAARAGDLCRQMLAYSGRGAFVIDRIHLGEVVTDLASMIEVSLFENTELCVDVGGDSLPIEADASQMHQVVLNLVTNAAEAIGSEAGLIRVTVAPAHYSEERLHAEYWQAGLHAGTYVALQVEDTGCGMDAETRERIFEPFFTTKFTGRGLGLAAIQGIVRGHGGATRVGSELGRGTTVTVLLPVAVGDARPRVRAERSRPEVVTHGTILVADDDPRVLEIESMMLENAGFEVIAVEDGQRAVDVFRERAREIQCVVLDLTMPVMNGEQAFRALREIRGDVPVILCSGFTAQELDNRFDDDRPAGFLEKPFKADALLDLIAEVAPLHS